MFYTLCNRTVAPSILYSTAINNKISQRCGTAIGFETSLNRSIVKLECQKEYERYVSLQCFRQCFTHKMPRISGNSTDTKIDLNFA